MADQTPGSPGRRLRLMRRKCLLDQAGLAKLLGTDQAAISKMENNVEPLSAQAEAFLANPPAPVPAGPGRPSRARRTAPAAARAAELPPDPEADLAQPPREPGEAGPRVEDAAPRAAAPAPAPARPRAGEIAELEAALLKMFAGETFLVPKQGPDGTVIQVEAVIPGIAQVIGMADEFDGMVIRTYAPGMARAWAELARENETVRKVLIGVTYGGAYRGVIAATLPAVLAIAAHHGALGLGRPPVVDVAPHPAEGDPLFTGETAPLS